jgi:hypothetical protein
LEPIAHAADAHHQAARPDDLLPRAVRRRYLARIAQLLKSGIRLCASHPDAQGTHAVRRVELKVHAWIMAQACNLIGRRAPAATV